MNPSVAGIFLLIIADGEVTILYAEVPGGDGFELAGRGTIRS
jgi:hypothetical protein